MNQIVVVAVVGIALLAVLAPLLASSLAPVIKIPLVVFEIVLGLIAGPAVLGWVPPTAFTSALADFGLAMLFFLAGNEIDFEAIKGRPLARSATGWGSRWWPASRSAWRSARPRRLASSSGSA